MTFDVLRLTFIHERRYFRTYLTVANGVPVLSSY